MHRLLMACSALALGAGAAHADMNFNRISAFSTVDNMAAGEDRARESSAEIIDVTADGMMLVYTDSPLEVLGRIDITDPHAPKPAGNIALPGEPTSVAVLGDIAFVGVNTSPDFVSPSGMLKAIHVKSGEELASCTTSGQPDSIALSKDGSFVVVAIENERDEDLNNGVIPQAPAGTLDMFRIADGNLTCEGHIAADMTGLADVAPTDPEPEFVDVNGLGETVVTMQENNHLAVVDAQGHVISHFSAGAVDLTGIDATDERGALRFTETQEGRKREPDAVKWIDDNHFATANEGDYEGGSRGWTIFNKNGTVVYESGTSFEHALIQIGHYPDKRSDSKGVEPESIETATFGDTPYVFVGSERGSAVGVYDVTDLANPVLKQILASGIGPEGYVAIPERNLLVSANEVDLIEDGGIRSHVMIFEYQDAAPVYPTLTSAGADTLIGWGALSGMVADENGLIYAVNDSFYGYQPTIFTIDPSTKPARITAATEVTRAGFPAQKLDMEGITLDGKGGFWIASEGRPGRLIPHAIYNVNAKGQIKKEIPFPAELLAVEKRWASEGITRVGDTLWIAIQRQWKDDPENTVKLVSYNIETEEWGAVRYPTNAAEKGWVGLSEIVADGDWFYVIERDNQIGANAAVKSVYRIPAADMVAAPLGGDLPTVSKELVRDLIPDLAAYNGYVVDKVEGLAITPAGEMFVSTDNDGVDDSSGETFFWSIGAVR